MPKALSALTEDRSMTSITRENNASVNTVQRLLGACSHRFLDGLDYLPEHLAFDEFKGVDRKLHFAPEARANVKTVAMDLNFYYQDIVRACFPNAQIVIDRF